MQGAFGGDRLRIALERLSCTLQGQDDVIESAAGAGGDVIVIKTVRRFVNACMGEHQCTLLPHSKARFLDI